MNRLILIILLFLPFYSFSKEKAISDGPYIFIEKNKLVEKNIINNKVFSKVLESDSFDTAFIPEKSTFNNIKKIAVLSDIHGQYEILITLLKNNNIIDEKENWIFGEGHLVINGDIFDRGNKVNEVLWLVFELEIQAIVDGEIGPGMQGFAPILNGQLNRAELESCEADETASLKAARSTLPEPTARTKGPRYVPIARRGDKPDAISWLVKHHPELTNAHIGRLIGTPKDTIMNIR